jgi:hypothetical protein
MAIPRPQRLPAPPLLVVVCWLAGWLLLLLLLLLLLTGLAAGSWHWVVCMSLMSMSLA